MRFSILVPYAPSTPERDRLWAWSEKRWATLFPDVEVITAAPDRVGHPGYFNHPQAINRAARDASGGVFVIADADTVCDPDWLVESVTICEQGGWALPELYVQLHEAATGRILAGPADMPLSPFGKNHGTPIGASWSGIVVVPRAAFELLDGSDERHLGWGWDDICFGVALETLWQPVTRHGRIWHLWHPVGPEDAFGQTHTHDQRALTDRYLNAAGNPTAMRLVREGHRL